MSVFKIYRNGKFFDEVFYCFGMKCDEVKKDLIEHDGYPKDIVVKAVRLIVKD